MAPPAPSPFSIVLTPVAIQFNTPIGIDHHEPSNQVVMSVNHPTGEPYNFELVAPDGTRTRFSTIHGFTDEVKIATVRSGPCEGGFVPGTLFTGTGVPGEIARIAADGNSVTNPWVSLPGETGLMRGSLFQDRYCAFGGDLIAVTTMGNVWRVTSGGVATRLAQAGVHLEGLTTVPNESRYGPWAGRILAGAENVGCIYAIEASGATSCWSVGISPEDLDVIPADENFYGVDYGAQTLWGADRAQWTAMVGDFAIAQEFPGQLWHVRWDGQAFVTDLLATVTQWEHVTFSPARLPTNNTRPTVSSFTASPGVEGSSVTFAVAAQDDEGDPLTYAFDFESDGIVDVNGTGTTASHIFGDDFVGTATVRVSDGLLAVDATVPVVVENVPPSILGDVMPMTTADVGLRVAGEMWHDVSLVVVDGSTTLAVASVVRTPGSPDAQAVTIPSVSFNVLSSTTGLVVTYTPDDDSVNGRRNGANPAWIVLSAPTGQSVRLHHTFNVRHPETWTWRVFDLRALFVGFPITFGAAASDPGSDDLTFAWTFGDGSASVKTTFYNNGVSPDPHLSPEVNPITASDVETHVFASAGTYSVTLIVTDDDGGMASATFSLTVGG